jgi:hypothetical protein
MNGSSRVGRTRIPRSVLRLTERVKDLAIEADHPSARERFAAAILPRAASSIYGDLVLGPEETCATSCRPYRQTRSQMLDI